LRAALLPDTPDVILFILAHFQFPASEGNRLWGPGFANIIGRYGLVVEICLDSMSIGNGAME